MSNGIINIVHKGIHQGDLILAVGTGLETLRLLVDSNILSAASQTFKVLLSPHFKEGQTFKQNAAINEPTEIPFPEDHPQAMKMICQGLHSRNADGREVEWNCNPNHQFIIGYGNIIDKYFLHEATDRITELWFDKMFDIDFIHLARISSYIEPNLDSWVELSVLLDHAYAFEAVTRYILWHCTTTMCNTMLLESGRDIGKKWQITHHLSMASNRTRSFIEKYFKTVESRVMNGCECSVMKNSYVEYLKAQTLGVACAGRANYRPFQDRSIKEMAFAMKQQGCPKLLTAQCCWWSHVRVALNHKLGQQKEWVNVADFILNYAKGLCLDCIDRPEMKETDACRIHRYNDFMAPTIAWY